MFYRGNFRIPHASAIILAMCAILLLPWLGETLFNSKGEPREAIVAVSMLESGNWILPLNFGEDFPFKPPFMAWIIAALSWLLNGGVVTEYLSRLPSALAAIGLVMAGFSWARKERGDRFAMLFSIVTLTCFEVFRAAMACRLDMVLTVCMVVPLYLLHDILADPRSRTNPLRWLSAWALLTCAVLTKGPVGALLPGLVAGVYWLLRGQRFFPTLLRMLALALAAMIIPALWYYAAWMQGGDSFLDLMLEENIGRLTGNMSYESHEQPFWYNFVTLIAGCLPWTLLALFALADFRRMRRTPLKPAGLLALTAVVIIVGFYCIPASKRSVYLLPAYPFVCYAITSILDSTAARRSVRAFTWLMACIAIVAPVAFVVMLIFPLPSLQLTSPHWYAYITLAAPLAAGLAWVMNRHSPVGHLAVTVWAIYLSYIACFMPAALNGRSDRHLMEKIGKPENILILQPADGQKNRFYTLDFYYRDKLRPVASVDEAEAYPAGTVLLFQTSADTTGLHRNYRYSLLTPRGSDHRSPVGMAVRQ